MEFHIGGVEDTQIGEEGSAKIDDRRILGFQIHVRSGHANPSLRIPFASC